MLLCTISSVSVCVCELAIAAPETSGAPSFLRLLSLLRHVSVVRSSVARFGHQTNTSGLPRQVRYALLAVW